jgi:hypothetical protein
VNRQRKVAIGSVVAACAIIVVVIIAVVLYSSNPKTAPSTSSTSTTVTSTTLSPHLGAIHLPSGSVVIFNIASSAVTQPTAQLPANEAATLYYTCIGSARLTITFNGKLPIVTTPCDNQAQFVEVAAAPKERTVIPQSPTTVAWQVVAVRGPTS